MFNRIKAVFLTFLLLFSSAYAQKIQLGFRIEPTFVQTQHGSEIHPYEYFYGIQANASVFPVKWMAIEGRAALVPSIQYYAGGELGIIAKFYYTPDINFLKSVYVAGGYISHTVFDDGHMSLSIPPTVVKMPTYGIGLNLWGAFNLELLYLNPQNKAVGSYWPFLEIPNEGNYTKVKLKNIWKLGIGFSWDIISWGY
ncbi:MAG: hypothetical protein HF314_06460 [Ignavibacteria bacterium]|jgi:hypothetical protein|nr:hypothetical protein [Ignavibacteria bacterium]MCU7502697.1 hypothetical protein [Ignavibacteria bacterium]MCU7517374.1 hypothetical protein [Ignavibacteria bacterium]